MFRITTLIFIFISMAITSQHTHAQEADPYLWLEEVDGEKALKWAEEWSSKTTKKLSSHPDYDQVFDQSLEVLNSDERIVAPSIINDQIFNFWQDADNPRGIWRYTTAISYLNGEPEWEVLLDLDKMSEEDDIKWVFKGATGLYPDYERFLVSLSKGGGDAVEVREFDLESKRFVEDGFFLPEAKGGMSWINENEVIVATDFGDGMTTSGYPKQVKAWKRGTSLDEARLLFEGEETDVIASGFVLNTPESNYTMILQKPSFFLQRYYGVIDGDIRRIEIPEDAEIESIFKGMMIVNLKSDWAIGGKEFVQGSVLSIDYQAFLDGKRNFEVIFKPDAKTSVQGISRTANYLLFDVLSNVRSELYAYSKGDTWQAKKLQTPAFGRVAIGSTSSKSDQFFYYNTGFLEPSTLYYAHAQKDEHQKIKSLPSFFPSEKYQVLQMEAKSKDGTQIPYFVVASKDFKRNGQNPTYLYAYGGFEVSLRPFYSATMGRAWLEKGGVYVLANIRGGGEFGPKWHQAGLKENRQRVYEDFHAVAESLIENKITTADQLGIGGGSNGGLLVGVAFTQRPDLYKAVVCQVPLLDMKRYNKLLAGASWMGEYGDPDIEEEWAYIKEYSPYHNLKEDGKYPKVYFSTSTRDDRVHPGHARKMVAKMTEMGHEVLYYENTEGGHAGSSTNEQRAKASALMYSYLYSQLMLTNQR
ncbi:MAG: prolyl oligopeptidase family serine peptidase [Bacteroidota bacterium]